MAAIFETEAEACATESTRTFTFRRDDGSKLDVLIDENKVNFIVWCVLFQIMHSLEQKYLPGNGSIIWGGAFVFAFHLLKMENEFKGKKILELGCGCGLTGIVALSCGYNVTQTDMAHCLPDLLHNMTMNHISGDVRELDWFNPEQLCEPGIRQNQMSPLSWLSATERSIRSHHRMRGGLSRAIG